MKSRTKTLAAVVTSIAMLAGCAQQKSQKQAATEQWGRTRATVLLSLASDQYRSGNLEKSTQTVDQAMAIDPTNVELQILKARLQIEEGQLESALHMLESAAGTNPNHAEIDYLKGVIHQRWQRPQQALESYSAAARKNPNDVAYLLAQAEALVSMDRQPEALELLLARVVYFEHSAAIRDAIAQLYEQSGELELAVEYYRQASVLDTADDGIRERLALALYRAGNYMDANAQMQRMLKRPENHQRTDLLVAIGECESQLGMYNESRHHFEQATHSDSSLTSAWLGVARTSLKIGDLRRADRAAAKAVSLVPQSGQAQMTLGYVRMKQGRFDEAAARFGRASAADQTDSLSPAMVGLALQRKGKSQEANEWYRRALAIDPNDSLASQLLANALEE